MWSGAAPLPIQVSPAAAMDPGLAKVEPLEELRERGSSAAPRLPLLKSRKQGA